MSRAFPDQGINSFTAVSENLREHLTAIINTFVLPEAPLAINIPSSMVNATRAYLAGGQLTFGMIDRVKDHVVDLLYSNVYIRYCSQ
ncbi:hypothetical protein GGI12_004280 [Dipsacomyces acuminosporus]|nr:hypothetical protein GGI12_004280 [Dipsacomyces acuminosporus]